MNESLLHICNSINPLDAGGFANIFSVFDCPEALFFNVDHPLSNPAGIIHIPGPFLPR